MMVIWMCGRMESKVWIFAVFLGIQCVAGRCGEAWQIEVVCASGT